MSLSDVEAARRASVIAAIAMARRSRVLLVVFSDVEAAVARKITRKVCSCDTRKEPHLHVEPA